ncbi:tetratricopeptide repeat protein [Myroides sp. TSA_177.3]|uniref:tetratricopeptide repeat protein n=1 Tax=Myroides sp. TSA_177.3 TaxID=3415650 RepID=UPI0040452233
MNKKYSISLLALALSSSFAFAQSINEAKTAINAEQFDKAKEILKDLIGKKPADGVNYFYLGDVFLKEDQSDSARYYFDQGLLAKTKGSLNYIGLGQIELDNNRSAEAVANFKKAEKDIKKKDYNEQLLVAAAYLNSKMPNAKEAQTIAADVVAKDYSNPMGHLLLGRAFLEQKNLNDAFASFRNAYDLDNTLVEAKLQMAMITKRARAYADAIKACEEILATTPGYAPAYREIAEISYMWSKANAPREKELIAQAGENYKKFIKATDNSIDSQMRYADFLVKTENYPELERVATQMKDIKGVNPRIHRYLGYAAYENKNYQVSVDALDKFLKVYLKESKSLNAIGRDYMYLGLSEIGLSNDGENKELYNKGLNHLKDAINVEIAIAGEFNRFGLDLFRAKKYQNVIDILSISADVKESSGYIYDNYYVGYSYYLLGSTDRPDSEDLLKKADEYLAKTIEASPLTQEAYFYRARANRYIDHVDAYDRMFESYQGFLKVLGEKNELKDAANKEQVIEAHTSIATYYANKNRNAEAVEEFKKVLNLDPTNSFAKKTIEAINKG